MDKPPVPVLTHLEVKQRLAANLRRLRQAVGVSQERLALDAAVDRTMVSKIERQISNPSVETLLRLSNRLGVDVWVLLHPEVGQPYSLHQGLGTHSALPATHALHERGTDGADASAGGRNPPRDAADRPPGHRPARVKR